MKTQYQNCPRCDNAWGAEEVSFQECDSCNWPNEDFDALDSEDELQYQFEADNYVEDHEA